MSAAPELGVTAEDVGNVLLYVAPGFFARIAYTARFPQPKQESFYATVVSVATSVPIVAIGGQLAEAWGWPRQSSDVRYVLMLLGLGIVAGYVVAAVRGSALVRRILQKLKIPSTPEATVYEQTVLKLPIDSEVTLTFNDGRIASGYPTLGPGIQEEGVPRELYLSRPRWWSSEDDAWQSDEKWRGLIVNLDEVASVMLADDPVDSRNERHWPEQVRKAVSDLNNWRIGSRPTA